MRRWCRCGCGRRVKTVTGGRPRLYHGNHRVRAWRKTPKGRAYVREYNDTFSTQKARDQRQAKRAAPQVVRQSAIRGAALRERFPPTNTRLVVVKQGGRYLLVEFRNMPRKGRLWFRKGKKWEEVRP